MNSETHSNNKKLKTEELKKEAYRQYCAHISQGIPKKAWKFKHPEISLTWETMEKYIKEEPDTFDPTQKKMAEADALFMWFDYLSQSAKGKNREANVASLQIILRNMFAWDRENPHSKNENTEDLKDSFAKIMHQLNQNQSPHPQKSPQ